MIYRIAKNDPELKGVLWTGCVPKYETHQRALLKTAVKMDQEEVFFELIDHRAVQVSFIKKWFTSLRAISLTATGTPALAILLSGTQIEGQQAELVAFWLSFASVLLLQIAVNVLNDVEDHVNLVDAPGDVGGSGVIQKGWITARSLARFGYAALGLGILLGIYPLISRFQYLWPIVLLSLVGVVGYSGAPFRFKYRAIGDYVVFFLCGPFLAYGFSEVAFGKFGVLSLLIGLIFGLAATGILHANNLNDLEVDLSRGARTIANRIGFEGSKRYLFSIYFLIAALLILGAVLGKTPLWFSAVPFLVTPLVIQLVAKVKKATGPMSPSINKIRFEAAQIHLLIGLTWIIGFGVEALVASYWRVR